MRNRRVEVAMGEEFRAVLEEFAVEQQCSAASIMLRATKVYLSQHHRWSMTRDARKSGEVPDVESASVVEEEGHD